MAMMKTGAPGQVLTPTATQMVCPLCGQTVWVPSDTGLCPACGGNTGSSPQ